MLHSEMKSSKQEVKLFCLKMDFIKFLILLFACFCVKTFRYMRLKKCNRLHFGAGLEGYCKALLRRIPSAGPLLWGRRWSSYFYRAV